MSTCATTTVYGFKAVYIDICCRLSPQEDKTNRNMFALRVLGEYCGRTLITSRTFSSIKQMFHALRFLNICSSNCIPRHGRRIPEPYLPSRKKLRMNSLQLIKPSPFLSNSSTAAPSSWGVNFIPKTCSRDTSARDECACWCHEDSSNKTDQ